jgi:hypothetical protein
VTGETSEFVRTWKQCAKCVAYKVTARHVAMEMGRTEGADKDRLKQELRGVLVAWIEHVRDAHTPSEPRR